MADDLTLALKLAKQSKDKKKQFFAFLPKGSEGTLLISKKKIPPKEVAEAKKESGAGTPITGKVFGGGGTTIVFLVAKAVSATIPAMLKKVIKKETGLTVDPEIRLANDADAEEPETGEDAATKPKADATAPPAAPPQPPPAPAAPAGQGNLLGIQKALQKLGYDPGKLDGVMGPNTQAAVKKFQQANGLAVDGIPGAKTQAAIAKALQGGAAAPGGGAKGADAAQKTPAATPPPAAPDGQATKKPAAAAMNLGPWQSARQDAINELKALASKVAATKHQTAAAVVKEIQFIISKLPAAPAVNDIDKLEDFVRKDETITAAENIPSHFHVVKIRDRLLQGLEGLRTA
jgi:peptidoglycan hydrolase-like protein with peptidoglycan-binding domain